MEESISLIEDSVLTLELAGEKLVETRKDYQGDGVGKNGERWRVRRLSFRSFRISI